MYKLRTIDVWDTLLRRDCHPECIKLATACHVALRYRDRLADDGADHWQLYRLRLEIEGELAHQARASGHDDEYRIEEVVSAWLTRLVGNGCTAALVEQVVEFEIATEIARSAPDTTIVTLLERYPAEQTLFLSDFYMGAEHLQRLLASKGLSALAETGISSCDAGMNKRSGRLFTHLHQTLRVDPAHHFHIGDNIYSDVEAARALGITAEHYLPTEAHAVRQQLAGLFDSREALFRHVHSEVIEAAAGGERGAAYRAGLEAAPLVIGFALFVAEYAIANRLERVHFLTREGTFFAQVFADLFPSGNLFGCSLPPIQVLEVSRLSTFAATLGELDLTAFQRIWRLFRIQRVEGIFTTLGLDANEFAGLLDSLGLEVSEIIAEPATDPRLAKLFADTCFDSAARAAIARRRELLTRYLAEHQFGPAGRHGVVDIGWRGTIQDNLALLNPGAEVDGLYLALRKPLNPQPANTDKAAYVTDEREGGSQWLTYTEAATALEFLFTPVGGSVVGYVQDGDRVAACRQPIPAEDSGLAGCAGEFQEGVRAAAKIWAGYIERYVVSASEVLPLAQQVWRKLSDNPPEAIVAGFLRTPQHDLFGFGDIFHRTAVPSLASIALAPFSHRHRLELIGFMRRLQWTAAVKQLDGIGVLHRWTLLTLFRTAHRCKRLQVGWRARAQQRRLRST